ncbi:T9SS type A sorting domain-containing protein [bacterium]|jgi:hypothetical protein|nr:T9SS type A sorting domain-containing protein [bacterium]MBT4249159.1 T9SS type A sorting domain-containing protein [bacterium]MBT6777969.1 T9SS type A sorting domain-containing protein [bacterium]
MKKIVLALIIAVFQPLAMADCIDESNISDDFACIEIWNPVCGCDGITYSNNCFAENAGVINWIEGECQQQDETLIEGRWVTQFEGNTSTTMYEFLDGFRYTYYCNDSSNDCDSTYWNSLDTSDALPTINPYTVNDSTLSIDLHFGNIATYTLGFRCDGQQVDFYYDEDDLVEGLHSSMARVGVDYVNGECYSIEGRWLWNYGGFAYSASTMYEFLDGFRYTYYCISNDCDSTYWNSLDTSNAIPNPDLYTFINDTLAIDENSGSFVNFECNGDIISFGDNTLSYLWRVDLDTSSCENQIVAQQLTSSEGINKPEKFRLNQNYPNPFNPITSLSYDLVQDAYVSVTIYDVLGNVINHLVSTNQSSGFKSVQWDATNNQGQPVSAGVYFYTIQVGDYRHTKKMILLK